MEAKFTKGPWVKGCLQVFGANGDQVVVSDGPAFGSKSSWKDAEANANLIMAAPELYDALDSLIDSLASTPELNIGSWGIDIDEAKAALAKARGEKNS